MGQSEVLQLSYFGRVANSHDDNLRSSDELERYLAVEPDSVDQGDKTLFEKRIIEGRISLENLYYLYSTAVQIAENISMTDTSEASRKTFIITVLLRVSHKVRIARAKEGGGNPEEISQINKAIALIENDREFMDVLIDRAIDDAALNLLRVETRTRAGAVIH